ncbi:UNVERIFIED_CONTAM: Transposon Tf2-12 polyprotein [Sesamum latifolium]|uniref:Transposon Tf2-12 polyprotein n=1 Tax=Sesamum latifolium TaxID=2727402 RepID=A0AAW2TPF7_9LAMI
MIDTTTGHEALSFMDGSSGYNQIRMAPADEELTAFRTPKGIYCYKVMPFGLKNTGATYQRAMQRIFDDMLHKNVECYVDDLVVKSKKREDHLYDLRKVFERLRRYQLKMNPSKCAFGVTSKKFLGFIVRQRGIKIEQAKIDAILRMPKPRNIHELKSLQGKLAYLEVSKANPLKYVMTKPVLSDRLARWYLQLQQFEITYVPQKAVKGQVLADFLADHPMPAEWELSDDLPDEDILVIEVTPPWKMYFDGASHKEGAGAGVVFVTSEGEVLPYSFTLTQNCSNNMAEYQALIFGLEMAVDTKQRHLKVLMGWLGDVELEYLPRGDNKQADALAKLASIFSMTDKEARIPICKSWIIPPIFSDDEDDTFQEEENHVMELPSDPRRWTDIRRRATRFIYYKGTLYRWSFEGIFLCCLSDDEKDQAMEEAHSGVCGAHQSGPKLHFCIKRMGYYWPTMVKDCIDYAKRCQACQFHANLIHQPPEPLHPTVASWLSTLGFGCCGAYNKVLRRVPRYIITDNGKPFCNSLIDKLCQKFGFKQRNSSMYYAAANGLAEAFNKTLCSLLKKVIAKSKRDWHERIEEALWAYRTTVRTPTQSTPYSLVYIVEAVLPLEQQIPLLRIAIQEGLTEEENARIWLEELEALDEKRLEAQQRLECYQARLSKAFNKKVCPCSFQVGDLVLAVKRPIITTHWTENKFLPKWDGPYVVKEAYTNGAYKLVAEDGLRIGTINGKFLKRYYA